MAKITYDQYLSLLRDPETDDETIEHFSILVSSGGGFDVQLRPDPCLVQMTSEEAELEDAMKIGNGLARFRRKMQFKRRLAQEDLPVLVSEGDSWFQFPVLIREVIDNLKDDYLIWSVGAAGDTAQNMVFNSLGKRRTEYMRALRKQKKRVRGFLFSAAGNDVIGEDPDTKKPVLFDLLREFRPGTTEPEDLIDQQKLTEVLAFLERAYRKVFTEIRAEPGFEQLPIFIHAYDYPFPYPWGDNDPRSPLWAENDQWLGRPLNDRGIEDPNLRRGVIKVLIDRLYDRFGTLAQQFEAVSVVDCRGAMPQVDDWADEIHGTSKGFKAVAGRFKDAITPALS